MAPRLGVRGDLLVAGLARATSAARDAHRSPEQPRDHGTQAALHARGAASTWQRAAIGGGPSTGPSPARAALARLGRQLSCFLFFLPSLPLANCSSNEFHYLFPPPFFFLPSLRPFSSGRVRVFVSLALFNLNLATISSSSAIPTIVLFCVPNRLFRAFLSNVSFRTRPPTRSSSSSSWTRRSAARVSRDRFRAQAIVPSKHEPLVPHITCTHQESTSETGLHGTREGGALALSLSFEGNYRLPSSYEQDRILGRRTGMWPEGAHTEVTETDWYTHTQMRGWGLVKLRGATFLPTFLVFFFLIFDERREIIWVLNLGYIDWKYWNFGIFIDALCVLD